MVDEKLKDLLGKAIHIAIEFHENQKDKAGFPYILHPMRVMMNMKTIRQKIIAISHDLLEDTKCDEAFLLRCGYYQDIIDDIKLLTNTDDIDYTTRLKMIKEREDSRLVKIEDMKDNCNILRYHELEEKHLKMVKKYHQGIKILELDADERLEI